jgi:hypothetical protein
MNSPSRDTPGYNLDANARIFSPTRDSALVSLPSSVLQKIDEFIQERWKLYKKLNRQVTQQNKTVNGLLDLQSTGRYPTEINWKFNGFIQYPASMDATLIAETHAIQRKAVKDCKDILLQSHITSLSKNLESLKASLKVLDPAMTIPEVEILQQFPTARSDPQLSSFIYHRLLLVFQTSQAGETVTFGATKKILLSPVTQSQPLSSAKAAASATPTASAAMEEVEEASSTYIEQLNAKVDKLADTLQLFMGQHAHLTQQRQHPPSQKQQATHNKRTLAASSPVNESGLSKNARGRLPYRYGDAHPRSHSATRRRSRDSSRSPQSRTSARSDQSQPRTQQRRGGQGRGRGNRDPRSSSSSGRSRGRGRY